MKKTLSLLLFVVIALPLFVLGESLRRVESLRGVDGVSLEIAPLREEVKQEGLSKEKIQTEVELTLQNAGIKVLDSENNEATDPPAILAIAINLQALANLDESEPLRYAFNVEIGLVQHVEVERMPGVQILAETWEEGSLGYLGTKENGDVIIETILTHVDRFASDYLEVNPSQRSSKHFTPEDRVPYYIFPQETMAKLTFASRLKQQHEQRMARLTKLWLSGNLPVSFSAKYMTSLKGAIATLP